MLQKMLSKEAFELLKDERMRTGKLYGDILNDLVLKYISPIPYFNDIENTEFVNDTTPTEKGIDLSFDKYQHNTYTLEVDYDDLNVIYHCMGNYVDLLNSIIHLGIGIYKTKCEDEINSRCNELCGKLREIEPKLYYDFRADNDESYL